MAKTNISIETDGTINGTTIKINDETPENMDSFSFYFNKDDYTESGGYLRCDYRITIEEKGGLKSFQTFELSSKKGDIIEIKDKDLAARWTRKFINSLPDSSFAVVESAYSKGDTDNKNARHLPYKNAGGKVDIPHLRNALARMNQIKPVTDSMTTDALRAKAKRVLTRAAKKHLKTTQFANINMETLRALTVGEVSEILQNILK